MSYVQKTWRVEGMHCPRCEAAVRRALTDADGLREVVVRYPEGTITAQWDASALPEAEIGARLRDAGYGLRPEKNSVVRGILRLLLMIAAAVLLYLLLTRTAVSEWMQAFPMAREGMGLGMLFVVGLATSLHCVAMCGGINIAQSAASAQRGHRPSLANLLYNLGRLTSYTLIGGIVGALGKAFSISISAKATIQLIAAAFMLVMALNLLGGFRWLHGITPRLPKGWNARLAAGVAGKSSYYIGLANGLMPCGPLQAMQLYALSAGSWWMGALSMFCFCLGTIPLMLCVGWIGGSMNRRFAKPMRMVSALLVLAMGMSAMTSGLALAGIGVAAAPKGGDGIAVVDGDVQYVYSELDFGGYPVITVQAGIPVEWTIHADESRINSCNNEIYIPEFDLSVPLKPGDNLVHFTPEQSGTIPYTCWMGMIRSTIYVTDSKV